MLPENAAALVGAGVLSVVAFPGAAVALHHREIRSRGPEAEVAQQDTASTKPAEPPEAADRTDQTGS